ncbi:MAG: response regulator transcription factor [Eubacteriales bacterium]
MARILIVEDDVELNAITKAYLVHAGFDTVSAFSCHDAETILETSEVDLILLDMMLPDQWGTALCQRIREKSVCPIIFVSCIDDKQTMLDAFEVGGDDYMVKPVDYDQMIAKINVILRRISYYAERSREQAVVRVYRQFTVDTERRRVTRTVGESQNVELSPIEYQLLAYMVENQDNLLLYADLYSNVWGNDAVGDVRTVMVHISNLRKKIDPQQTGMITTVRGAGYFFSDVAG